MIFERNDSDPRDELVGMNPGHGTGTASIIMSAVAPPDVSGIITGAAPRVTLIPLRVATSVVHLSFLKLTRAITYAADHGHHVLSMSLGGPVPSYFLRRAIQSALDRGVILFASAGNYWPWVVYPAAYEEVVAVAACNCAQDIWALSSGGPGVDITAGGESVWMAGIQTDGRFTMGQASGTSFAAATVASIYALWLAHHGRDQLIARYGLGNLAGVFKEILMTAGVDTPDDWNRQRYGAGILNARKLLEAPLPDSPPAEGVFSLHAGPAPQGGRRHGCVCGVLPTLPPSTVYQTMAKVLGVDERKLGAVLSVFGEELRFHVATNPSVRDIITQYASGRLPLGLTVEAALAKNARFMHQRVAPAAAPDLGVAG